jgi:hypothetical protein
LAPTGRKVRFKTVDVMRVRNGWTTEHRGVANLLSLAQQLGLVPALDLGKQDWSDARSMQIKQSL